LDVFDEKDDMIVLELVCELHALLELMPKSGNDRQLVIAAKLAVISDEM